MITTITAIRRNNTPTDSNPAKTALSGVLVMLFTVIASSSSLDPAGGGVVTGRVGEMVVVTEGAIVGESVGAGVGSGVGWYVG